MKLPGLGFLKFHLYTRHVDAWDVRSGRRRLPAIRDRIHRLGPQRFEPTALAAAPAIAFLTGEPFLYQTVYSAASLLRATGQPFRLRIHDDGTLQPASIALLNRLFPGAVEYRDPPDNEARMDALFPRSRFPALRSARDTCALLRKLLDVHGGRTGWQLFVDSDTFFHRRPDLLLQHLQAGRDCYMSDHWSNYGHPPEWLERLCGFPVLRQVNSGLVGLRSESIDWDKLESWFAAMDRAGGNFVFFEQGVTALMLSERHAVALPAADYVLGPSRRETARPAAVFHHYAGNSKYRFLRYDVARVLFS